MSNLNSYKNAKSKADAEIQALIKQQAQNNDATANAIAYLTEYINLYKYKFKNSGQGYIQDKIITDLVQLFGNDIDKKIIKQILNRNYIISSKQILLISIIIIPSIISITAVYGFNFSIFINRGICIFSFIFGIILAFVWEESNIFRLYRIPKFTSDK